ncbi:MAG: L,D-transpeptidase, partial [Thermoleophilia bacterium]|nr:L,D-transpeptidase [Thermoleophilia bacterium]
GTPPPATTAIALDIGVSAKKVTKWVRLVKTRTLIPARNATWHLRKHRVVVARERAGRSLNTTPLKQLLVTSLTSTGTVARALGTHNELFTKLSPAVTRRQLSPVVVVDRSDHTATIWSPLRKLRTMPVAVGMTAHQTPLGSFKVVEKQKNPRWTPPNSEWAKDAQPIAAGPNNPLGTRWIGLSASGIGMHGTNLDSSVGSAVSHGCMRMHKRDVEWLYGKVRIGTPVVIVR